MRIVLPIRRGSLPSGCRSGGPAKPHFQPAISMTRHGTAGFYRVWRSQPCGGGNFPRRPACLPRHPRLERPRPARPGEVAEWSNAPHSKCGIGASLSGVRIPPSPPVNKISRCIDCILLDRFRWPSETSPQRGAVLSLGTHPHRSNRVPSLLPRP
jgi:hypothetical protein